MQNEFMCLTPINTNGNFVHKTEIHLKEIVSFPISYMPLSCVKNVNLGKNLEIL